jgi:Ribonuclease G/E
MTDRDLPPDAILVSRGPGETRSALVAGDEVLEVEHRRDAGRDRDRSAGEQILGRIVGRTGALAFIDIGDRLPAVMAAKRAPGEGQTLAVEIVVPARPGKSAEVTPIKVVAPEGAKAPIRLRAAPEPALVWWQKYSESLREIVVTPAGEARRLQHALGKAAPILAAPDSADVFEVRGVNAAIEAALDRRMPLACGGALIIESTAAATLIDIDSGAAAPALANGEGLRAAARAMRLRNIGGHVLIDAIPDARGRAGVKSLMAELTEALVQDPRSPQIAGMTPLGMIELTRRRVGLSLAELLAGAPAAPALSASALAYDALRRCLRVVATTGATRMTLAAPPAVLDLLRGELADALREAADRTKAEIALKARADHGIDVATA